MECLNDVYTFDIEKQSWTLVQTMGEPPPRRQYHVSAVLTHYMIIAGGVTVCDKEDEWKHCGDVHVLDLTSSTWEVVDEGSWVASYPWLQAVSRLFISPALLKKARLVL